MEANNASLSSSATRTSQQVRAEFSQKGQTIAGWARAHGFTPKAVQQVLARPTAGKFGDAHKIAVALGLKAGVVEEVLGA